MSIQNKPEYDPNPDIDRSAPLTADELLNTITAIIFANGTTELSDEEYVSLDGAFKKLSYQLRKSTKENTETDAVE
jgi:hypothetical protein